MRFGSIQTILIALLLTVSLPVFARQVTCPSVDLIKQYAQKLDTVTMKAGNATYDIYTFDSVLNTSGCEWQVGVLDMKASDFNNAFINGKNRLASATIQVNLYSIEEYGMHVCRYFDNTGKITLLALGMDNYPFDLKAAPSRFKLP
jgi:hypothetical protein